MNFIQKASVQFPAKIPDINVLKKCVKGLSFRIRHEYHSDKKERMKIIRDEIKFLIEQL